MLVLERLVGRWSGRLVLDRVRQPAAISFPWRLHLNFSCLVESNGWFTAANLNPALARPGHMPSLDDYGTRPTDRPPLPETCRIANSHNSA